MTRLTDERRAEIIGRMHVICTDGPSCQSCLDKRDLFAEIDRLKAELEQRIGTTEYMLAELSQLRSRVKELEAAQ